MTKTILKTLLTTTILAAPALAHESTSKRIDSHAPIGVMADHFHGKGEFMASLRGMYMRMDDPVNTMMGAQSMSMKMGMLGAMYAPSDNLTLMGMLNYVDNSMDMKMMGNTSSMSATDLGDLKLSAMIPLHDSEDRRFHITLGTSIPTGATGKTNAMEMRSALTMQPGTGSWGITPSATYTQFLDGWSYGVQANAAFWLDDNKYGEQMGNKFEASSWAAVAISDTFSLSARASYVNRDAVSGTMMMALADKREWLAGFVGANFKVGGHRFALEAGLPLTQKKYRNALDMGFSLTIGWQKSF